MNSDGYVWTKNERTLFHSTNSIYLTIFSLVRRRICISVCITTMTASTTLFCAFSYLEVSWYSSYFLIYLKLYDGNFSRSEISRTHKSRIDLTRIVWIDNHSHFCKTLLTCLKCVWDPKSDRFVMYFILQPLSFMSGINNMWNKSLNNMGQYEVSEGCTFLNHYLIGDAVMRITWTTIFT